MTLKQLLQNNFWLSISTILFDLYPGEEKNSEGYEDVYANLLMMNPEETDMTIVVKTVFDHFDGSAYVDVSGRYKHPKNEEEEFSQAIEFTPWKKWLGMDINEESLKEFTELEILAHCLYEMTFAGFEEEEVQEQLNNIEQSMGEYEKMTDEEKIENNRSLEDFLDDLMKDEEDEEENKNL
ncbi:DUF6557 family protein [Zunongwangia sp. F363]|uniref:DUF6557 family protein n=1 Tax=Autumnicola tepida TaxID=3075595 RepID=A0ABU3C8X7_9FLAO|nr:DUF6557 family protein [Zunongwangia sp. F363]MDT0642801.1 DUF6557 family protein [Zunongwangia sp. F363]